MHPKGNDVDDVTAFTPEWPGGGASMNGMTSHSKPETPRHGAPWTNLSRLLAVTAATVAIGITPLFFASLFITVRDLLAASRYGAWPWIVPLASEGCFLALFLMDVVLVLRRKPRGRLRFAPYLFAVGSLVLNFLAGHGDVAATAGHVMVTLAFFVTVIEGEEAVRKLALADRDARIAEMMADVRRYAIDVVRDRRGRCWRWRVPVLLRRDITSGRLSDEIRQAVESAVSEGRSSGWRQPVLEWVARELRLSDEADAAEARVTVAMARSAAESASASASVASAAVPPVVPPPAAPVVTPKTTPEVAAKPRRLVPARASDDELVELVLPLFEDGSEVTKYKITKKVKETAGGKTGIGDERAGRILELARRKRVVPIGERMRA